MQAHLHLWWALVACKDALFWSLLLVLQVVLTVPEWFSVKKQLIECHGPLLDLSTEWFASSCFKAGRPHCPYWLWRFWDLALSYSTGRRLFLEVWLAKNPSKKNPTKPGKATSTSVRKTLAFPENIVAFQLFNLSITNKEIVLLSMLGYVPSSEH